MTFNSSDDLPESTESTTNEVKAAIESHLVGMNSKPGSDIITPLIVSPLCAVNIVG